MIVTSNSFKQVFFGIGLLFITSTAISQEVLTTDSKLENVTIYSSGASMHHKTSRTTIPKGISELVINQIANQVNPESIRILSSNKDIQIQSVSFERDYVTSEKNKSSSYLDLKKQYDLEKELLAAKTIARESEESTLNMLKENNKIGGTNGISQANLANMLAYHRTEFKNISSAVIKLKKEEEEKQKLVNKLAKQLAESGGENANAGQIVLTLYSDKAVESVFSVDYYTYNVHWNPSYEIRVDDIEKPMDLVYNANLSQQTGIDWKNVLLSFSNANPNLDNNIPHLNPWWVSYEVLRPTPPAPIYARDQLLNKSTQLDEESALYALQGTAAGVMVSSSQLQTSFVINIPYDVYNNKKPIAIQLQNYKLPSEYTYYSVPSKQEAAYLIAKVSDWEQYNLLPGQAQLLIDKQYSGQSFIDPNTTLDTLQISLGQDQRIVTKRKRIDEKGSSASFLGSTQKRTYTYEIELRNTRNEIAAIEVKELFPISTEKDIVVKLEESSAAKIDKDKGELTWKLELKPNETKKLIVSYTVTSAKGKKLRGL